MIFLKIALSLKFNIFLFLKKEKMEENGNPNRAKIQILELRKKQLKLLKFLRHLWVLNKTNFTPLTKTQVIN